MTTAVSFCTPPIPRAVAATFSVAPTSVKTIPPSLRQRKLWSK